MVSFVSSCNRLLSAEEAGIHLAQPYSEVLPAAPPLLCTRQGWHLLRSAPGDARPVLGAAPRGAGAASSTARSSRRRRLGHAQGPWALRVGSPGPPSVRCAHGRGAGGQGAPGREGRKEGGRARMDGVSTTFLAIAVQARLCLLPPPTGCSGPCAGPDLVLQPCPAAGPRPLWVAVSAQPPGEAAGSKPVASGPSTSGPALC